MESHDLKRAVHLLRSGGLVAFPTETVYGIGADATNSGAVRKIFQAKGRPSTNPLIIHVADAGVARRFAADWPAAAEALAKRFWPGPLTLVVPKSEVIVAEATAGRPTVGLRAPGHPLALQLLRAFGGPVAAPSANRSNRISPTTAEHVRRELGNAVDLILDGGPCQVGIESTVLDLTKTPPMILRPGAVTRQQIEEVIGSIEVFAGSVALSQAAASPGQHEIHYSPAAPAYRFDRGHLDEVKRWRREHPHATAVFLLLESNDGFGQRPHVVRMPQTAAEYARMLYAALHDADALSPDAIFIELPDASPEWSAVRDRLMRATRPLVISS
ncbi:MAG TPA: L-threonylcarbamoyladenylate synthase [Tepidisphaeraceae bacterium]|nr:L-threonylcarbamoyladenylate synthase [Tepidisphaeraceae bacterium]